MGRAGSDTVRPITIFSDCSPPPPPTPLLIVAPGYLYVSIVSGIWRRAQRWFLTAPHYAANPVPVPSSPLCLHLINTSVQVCKCSPGSPSLEIPLLFKHLN
ncbi:hypothetical protein J6590_095979 [Homalodisca vitripennis]|nr:hypothetical protein J6590_095979 [Homalodisca vitripennis]